MNHSLPVASVRRFLAWTLFLIVALQFPASIEAQFTNGIYAEFNTSMGSYTCRLDYAVAPKAVANFIGLATGERAWLDVPSGVIRTNPFFNGTTFHRVIAGFMNQGGSRNGQGTDGPGYQFVDEFNAGALHSGFGVLSMANSGPDSNGSQFFVTVSSQPHLNGVHTVFGRIYGGSNVVHAINRVTVGTANKPLTNVVLQSVVIRRVGAAAAAFDIHAQGLPTLTNLNLAIRRAGTNVSLTFSNRLNAENRFYDSTSLQTWSGMSTGFETEPPLLNALHTSGIQPAQFFRAVRIEYPQPLFVPRNILGRTFTLNFSGSGTFNVVFDDAGTGTYTTSGGGSGPVLFYDWKQDPYRGRLRSLALFPNPLMDLHLAYSNSSTGTFKGTVRLNATNSAAVSGTFSASAN